MLKYKVDPPKFSLSKKKKTDCKHTLGFVLKLKGDDFGDKGKNKGE